MRSRAAAVLLAGLGVAVAAPAAAAQDPGVRVVRAVASTDRAGWLVAETRGGTGSYEWSIAAGGSALRVESTPLVGSRSGVSIVIDSAASDDVRRAGVNGAANLVMQLPLAIRTSVVVDDELPSVVPEPGTAADAVTALASIERGAGRATSDAIELAVQELDDQAGGRVVVLFTAAPDAGGESAAELAQRLTAKGSVLAVVAGNDAPSDYWKDVAAATGGIATAAGTAPMKAFDRVAAALTARHRLTFASQSALPPRVTVRARGSSGVLSAVAPLDGVRASATPTPSAAPTPSAGTAAAEPTSPSTPSAAAPSRAAPTESPDERSTAVVLVAVIVCGAALAILLTILVGGRADDRRPVRPEPSEPDGAAEQPAVRLRSVAPTAVPVASAGAVGAALASIDRYGAHRPVVEHEPAGVVPGLAPSQPAGVVPEPTPRQPPAELAPSAVAAGAPPSHSSGEPMTSEVAVAEAPTAPQPPVTRALHDTEQRLQVRRADKPAAGDAASNGAGSRRRTRERAPRRADAAPAAGAAQPPAPNSAAAQPPAPNSAVDQPPAPNSAVPRPGAALAAAYERARVIAAVTQSAARAAAEAVEHSKGGATRSASTPLAPGDEAPAVVSLLTPAEAQQAEGVERTTSGDASRTS